jgi:hypothetical protein
VRGVGVSENLQKLVGVVVMAVLVVVGVVVSSGDDTDFTRNRSFSSAAETFAGADRLEDPDCCDQNAYEISLLQAKYEDLQNEIALLKGNYEALADGSVQYTLGAYPPAPPSVQTIVDGINESCTSKSVDLRLGCLTDYLHGLELEFARQVVMSHGEFGFFHRYVQVTGAAKMDFKVAEEACGPIFYGYGPPPRYALAADTVDGLVVSYEIGTMTQKWSSQSSASEYSNWHNFKENNSDYKAFLSCK